MVRLYQHAPRDCPARAREAAPAAARQGGTPHSLDDSRGPAARCGRGDAVARMTARAARLLGLVRRGRLQRPDVLPPRRGGRPSSESYSAAGRPVGFARLRGTRRGFLRSARALAAAALLALFGALALPVTAEAEVLVSNLTQPVTGSGNLNSDQAQAFTTGAAHRLTSVTIQFSYVDNIGLTVSIWTDNGSGRPGVRVGSPLSNPSPFAGR